MPSSVKTLVCLLNAIVVVVPAIASADSTDDERARERGRWAVAFALTSGILIQQQNGFVATNAEVLSPLPWDPDIVFPAPFLENVQGSVDTVSPNIGANIEVMAPAIGLVPGHPRAFLTAEILPTFASDLSVALDGSATNFTFPLRLGDQPTFFPAASIGGQGSRLTARVMTTVLAANAGVAFDFEARGRLLRLKPSVGWIRWGVVSDGKVLAGYKDDPVFPTNSNDPAVGPYGPNIRLVRVDGHGSAFFNAVGPGLELEMELAKRGSLRPVLYASGFAYRTVGEDTIEYAASVFVDDGLGTADYGANWFFQVQPWNYRAAIGFRLRWVGD
jgi:hypothetical protein